ncbi:DNA-3-methyladenine glycosylase I, partial [Pseudomonas syringae]|nr:DNA-3-methyladenine glycosylase I [Pseudomonas syringae]
MATTRCNWVSKEPIYLEYHDKEWGVPVKDGRELFEMLCLEGQQAGLSWITVLRKRENYRQNFHHFDPVRIAKMTDDDVERLVLDAGIIRHRGKIKAIIGNAQAYLAMQAGGEDFSEFIWNFVGGQPVI